MLKQSLVAVMAMTILNIAAAQAAGGGGGGGGGGAWGGGSGQRTAPVSDAEKQQAKVLKESRYKDAIKQIEAGEYQAGIDAMTTLGSDFPDNANILNYIGFSYRKLGDLERSYEFYAKALRLNPTHRGVHEYLGELFLMRGEVENAEKMLTRLRSICPRGCDEREQLQQAIASYQTKE